MTNSYTNIWRKFIILRDEFMVNQIFKTEIEKYVWVMFARINSLCEDTMTLLVNNRHQSAQIIMRSSMETYIDFKNLIFDPKFIQSLKQFEREQDIYFFKNFDENNPYSKSFTRDKVDKRLDELHKENRPEFRFSIKKKFAKINELKLYNSVYNDLCRHSHGNITALASKNFEADRIVLIKEPSITENKFLYSTTLNMAICCSIDLMTYLHFDEIDISKFQKLLKESHDIHKNKIITLT